MNGNNTTPPMTRLLEGLNKFQNDYFSSHQELFEQLSHGQQPKTLFITCSDSRIDPNLITQAEVGELFIVRNAGNIIPPFGASNGGEGAAIEYAIQALKVEQIIVCGHSNCGAMKGLLNRESLERSMPLVYDWLRYAAATRLLVTETYKDFQDEEKLEITIAENLLSQLENLHTYPIVRSKLHQGEIALHAWIYRIGTGEILAYDGFLHDFVPPHSRLTSPESEYILHPSCPISKQLAFTVSSTTVA
jgi:carbonic anhydrase